MSVEPREFTDEEAIEFKLAMRDPQKWKELHEKTAQISKSLREKGRSAKKRKTNEYGFTDEEVDYIKDTFDENKPVEENTPAQENANNLEFNDDDTKFWNDAFGDEQIGGRRKYTRRRKGSRKNKKMRKSRRKSRRHYRKRR